MKSIIAVSIATAALSLGGCSKPEPVTTNLADNELALNEADFPAEGNPGEVGSNSTLGFDDAPGNADAGPGNEGIANGTATLNGN